MPDATCTYSRCKLQQHSRGLCSKHYAERWRMGGYQLELELTPRHRLQDVDVETATGVCSVCGPIDVRIRTGRRGHECMTLRRKYARRRGRADLRRKEKYGITPEEYLEMVAAQDGRCKICQNADKLVVDHCHKTGRVRGLLCHGCNVALGFLRDDPERAVRAGSYLSRFANSNSTTE